MTIQKRPNFELVKGSNITPLTLMGVPKEILEKVLKHLEENDKLFDYNVPREWRNPEREGLQEFLVKSYFPGAFEITDEDAIKKYIQLYDFIEYVGDIRAPSPGLEYNFYLKQGMKGLIKSVNLKEKYPLTVIWDKCDEFPKEKELLHTGEGLALLPKGIFRREKINSRVELLAEATPGRLVEPTKTSFEYSYYLPVGIKGIVTRISPSEKFPVGVVFGNTEEYIAPKSGYMTCKYSALKLLRENKFNIRELINESS